MEPITHTPVCQSCGMPLVRASDYGTDAAGAHVDDYCRFCFARGAFVDHGATRESMIDLCARILVQRGMAEPAAHTLMAQTIPTLKRWRES